MQTIPTTARYDGPIPFWERPDYQGEGLRKLRRMMAFDRRMVREYIAAIRGETDTGAVDRLMGNLAYHVNCHHTHARVLGALMAPINQLAAE